MSDQQKVLRLIEDGQWNTAMGLASALGFLNDEGFANTVVNLVIDGLKRETKLIDLGKDNEFVVQKNGMNIEMYVKNFENGMTGMKSSLKIEDDGSLSLYSFAEPKEYAPSEAALFSYYTLYPKKYTEQGLDLPEVLEKINTIYSFGGLNQKK